VPRAGLSRAVVVTEAARVADEVGLERLTLAAVAGRLGVRLPSLYKHIAGLEALQVHLAAAAGRELAAELSAATVGRSKGDALLAMAHAYRAFALRRPGAYAATLRAPEDGDEEHQAAAMAVLQVVLSVLAGFGLEGEDAIDAVRGLRALLHGFVAIEAAGGFKLPQDLDRSYRRLVQTYADTLSTWGRTASADAR
jgi:AcrR family transcriptional regulator